MPKTDNSRKQIKVVLPGHILDALRQDAKDLGERKVQTVIRQILSQHYRQQAEGAGFRLEELAAG